MEQVHSNASPQPTATSWLTDGSADCHPGEARQRGTVNRGGVTPGTGTAQHVRSDAMCAWGCCSQVRWPTVTAMPQLPPLIAQRRGGIDLSSVMSLAPLVLLASLSTAIMWAVTWPAGQWQLRCF